ncbi:MAG: MBL fold metallo-hydrolase [Candidatus Nitrosopelagicus sp.]|jgi:putative mRNA 3-end processing factor|nr:MBL fold metallo-hydrolase [Candidatus Nitrosopelagicus sp.]MBT3761599.1 MBL fold metallo-hydrolase [Candidatus Nitrosopelagicus sp.]MBT4455501.1 MBL fold metallo-hydrolase [Candidatus Nitrosopelagicus sp.]MBT7252781.1 MBL fold metallo-hydrolase [Candidatus Nitrosopelagicus sp.]|tara:strand:- start:146 stop:1414 length:1269 start_codon:yes stop_codon:yes gene_type:complete
MDIRVLGAAGEVGRSAFQVNCNGTNFLLDYGVMFGKPRGAPPTYPLHVKPRDIDSVIITHAHLDHSGCVPSLFVSGNCNVYATAPTFDLSKLLIQDMIKIEKNSHSFGVPEIDNMMQKSKIIGFKEKITRGNATFELRSSGHVVGGSTVMVESENKKLFYTGDINLRGSRLLPSADLDIGEMDMVITESTYSQENQMPRKESEKGLIDFANEVMDRKGTLFIPSFSVERSQEVASVLISSGFKHRIIMDGMALKVNEVLLKYPEYLRNPEIFKDVIDRVVAINDHKERKRALTEPCVVISPAGMLVGGNAVYYLQQLAFNDKNGIALVSYQGEGTPGKKLLDTGKVETRGKDLNVAAEVKQFQFSGHADRDSLFEMIKNLKGDPKIMTVHGDDESCTRFAEEIHEKFGFDAHAAKLDEKITI